MINQKQFIELSKKRVKELNGEEENESVLEAWRDGYIYFQEALRKSFETDHQIDFLEKVELSIYPELDSFDDEKLSNEIINHALTKR